MLNETASDKEPPDRDQPPAPPSYASLTIPSATNSAPRRPALQPSTSRARVEHQYSLFDSRNVPWATLKLSSNVASPRFLPSYFDGQVVAGAVELALAKPETILAVSITLSGTIVATNANALTFWELTHVLWSSDMGDPRAQITTQQVSPSPSSSRSVLGKSTTKLVGTYSWPFAITLPATCSVPLRPKQPPATLRLPPSFSEKGAAQFINYEINVRIRRGPLRIDNKLGTQFGFAPRVRPPAPSLLRRSAYQENTPLLGPEADVDGWEVLPPITICGKVFGVRNVEATCTFSFASPLTYTRGTPIPCSLTIACADVQALDLIFTPLSTSVYLIREVLYNAGGSRISPNPDSSAMEDWGVSGTPSLDSSPSDISIGVTASSPAPSATFSFSPYAFLSPLSRSTTSTTVSTSHSAGPSSSAGPSKTSKKAKKLASNVGPKLALRGARTAVACAVWWPASGADSQAGRRRMEGEVMLPKDFVPSFSFGGFSVSYSLALLPFHAPGFDPSPTAREPMLLARVQVATLHAQSPPPRSYAPPGVEAQRTAHQERVQKPMVWGLYNAYSGTLE
ncbi:hypothetical protein M0805_007584 [Coniferiporia weirii]|nr:hypothetical protein M0805_007584 [Coniferiporia weirii]